MPVIHRKRIVRKYILIYERDPVQRGRKVLVVVKARRGQGEDHHD